MSDEIHGGVLAELSDALAAAVERAARSTVTVSARRRLAASGIVWGEEVVLTADHVIEREEDIKIGLPDGSQVSATIAGRDPGSDLAVLRVSGGSLTPAEQAPESSARVGHLVVAVGRPSGDGPMASLGVVSAVGGPWRTIRGGLVDGYIRSDVTFYPGFSGGPLVDARGRVAGINSSRLGRGAGLTVPAAAAARIASALLSQGRIKRGYLGIGSQPVRLTSALSTALGGQETGLLIITVEPGSPADAGGTLLGDIIVSMAGNLIRDTDDLQAQLTPECVGQAMPLVVLRGGERRELTITVGERS